tara:strand:- start:2783 stop:3034 length:252 start_codon:yes stop_codon:yes gene_type:complete
LARKKQAAHFEPSVSKVILIPKVNVFTPVFQDFLAFPLIYSFCRAICLELCDNQFMPFILSTLKKYPHISLDGLPFLHTTSSS